MAIATLKGDSGRGGKSKAGPDDPYSRGSPRRRYRAAAIVLLGLVVSVHAFAESFDTLFASRNPALASSVTGAAHADVRKWQIGATRDPAQFSDSSIRSSAAAALRRNPLNPEALRALAYHEDAVGAFDRAGEIAKLSQDVTRRDELNQLLLARLAAREGDIAGAMDHLGTALTTSRRTREEVFALMVPLLPNADFREALAGEVTTDTEWMVPFFTTALRSRGTDARNVVDVILLAKPQEAAAVARAIGPELLSRSVRTADAVRTSRLFALQFPGQARLLHDAAISPDTSRAEFGLLGWSPIVEGTRGSQLGRTGKGNFGVLVYAASSKNRAPVLRRVLLLPAGEYVLSDERTRTGFDDLKDDDPRAFEWSVSCENGGVWIPLPLTGEDNERRFTLNADCPMQMVELQVDPKRRGIGVETVIEELRIRPAPSSGA